MDKQVAEEEKYWNELLQVLTADENFKLRKTEIDSLLATDTVEFFQHLNFFNANIEQRISRLKNNAQSKT